MYGESTSGVIVYAYSPYGEATALGVDEGNSIQYTARENDQTGVYFYRARYYDPVLKRFVSEDPLGIGGGTNLHAYVGGNPVSKTDPLGLIDPWLLLRLKLTGGTGAALLPFVGNDPFGTTCDCDSGQNVALSVLGAAGSFLECLHIFSGIWFAGRRVRVSFKFSLSRWI